MEGFWSEARYLVVDCEFFCGQSFVRSGLFSGLS